MFKLSSQEELESSSSQFVFIIIPKDIDPMERWEQFQEPLDKFLRKERVGEVSGGGSMESAPDAKGNTHVEFVGIDVELTDFEKGLPLLKSGLVQLGVPRRTVLEYHRGGVHHVDHIIS